MWRVLGSTEMTAPKHFLELDQFDGATLRKQLALGMAFKTGASENPRPLEGKTMAMIFEKGVNTNARQLRCWHASVGRRDDRPRSYRYAARPR